MYQTYEQWYCKNLRRQLNPVGWSLVIYYAILNVAVMAVAMVEAVVYAVSGGMNGLEDALMEATSSYWGYFLAVGIGMLVLLLWKKPKFWREEIWKKGKVMTPGSFFAILAIFLSGQVIYQIIVIGLEIILNSLGLTLMEGMEAVSAGGDDLSMFIYMGILAPVSEEILFRGLVQRSLEPYGKKFAIFCSALAFGLFHGNILQTPYAFAVGLVLGYVAAEYSIAWAMVLHLINNMLLGDSLTRLMSGMSEVGGALLFWGILLACAVAAIVIMIVNRRKIGNYLRQERIHPWYMKSFFGSAGMITFMVIMGLSIVGTLFVLITPM
ncbi:MAG: CPBP family intramembrane metalloprotease [Oscillospiraceae bacterium]|nr:CPBP family intramembrane metalloprotease [Oscillospiraceae bacterium]